MHRHVAVAITLCSLSAAAQPLDLAFVLDTTGSMSAEIREAKDRIHQLAGALQKARPKDRIRIGIVAYRDKGDEYVTRVSELSADVDASYRFLAELTADGGGDTPEDVLGALQTALAGLEWDASARTERQIFIIADAPPHLDYNDRPSTDDLVSQAVRRRIAVNVIGCRSLAADGVDYFRRLAYATEGSYQHIGRVSADEGLAKAMLETLAPVNRPDAASLPTVRLTPIAGATIRARSRGVVVTHFTDGQGTSRRCGVHVEIPLGYDLAVPPDVRQGADALLVTLRLSAGQGRAQRYVAEACLPSALPIRVVIGD